MAAKIFKSKSIFKALKVGGNYIARYATGRPVIMNLNFNVTNICNQKCPMCNAVITGDPHAEVIKYDKFVEYIDTFAKYGVASMSVSGGEPSLVPRMADMLDYAADKFPFGINVNTNLYANEKIITEVASAALRNNIRIGTSFDGFDAVADKLRGGKKVSDRVSENIRLVSELKKELNSSSRLNMHTVISDKNVHQIKDIVDFSERMGWTQTIAPVNNFFYQEPVPKDAPLLHHSKALEEAIAYAATKPHIACSKQFLLSIPKFTQSRTPKMCPYLTGLFKTNKIFFDVDGSVSLCSRKAIGNINTQTIEEMLKTDLYKKEIAQYTACQGCWMICYVEILLAMPKWYQSHIIKKMNKNKVFD